MLTHDETLDCDGFWRRVEDKRATAFALQNNKKHCREAWLAAGFAVEFALKAVIMRRRRLNRWPPHSVEPDLYTHRLRDLLKEAGLELQELPPALRGKVATALTWSRHHDYSTKPMPRKIAKDMVNAVLGSDGVVEWLKSV